MNTYTIQAFGRQWTIGAEDAVIEQEYAAGRFDEAPMLAFALDRFPSGGIWVDCGANIGNHTLAFCTRSEIVMAFEPHVENFTMLRRNVQANHMAGRTCLLNLATGLGPNIFSMQRGGVGRPSQMKLGLPTDHDPKVAVVALDAVVPHDRVQVLKIDVEGFEEFTLVGAKSILHASKPEVLVEIWEEDTFRWAQEYLGAMGYKLIDRWGHAPTYHFSASGRFPVTYRPPA